MTYSLDFELRKLIPEKVGEFAKLEKGQPYHFDHWGSDHSGAACMYYWFTSPEGAKQHTKRVLVSEIHAAAQHLTKTGGFDRNNFRDLCPVSDSSGHCGFVVVGRVLEALGVANYAGRQTGFVRRPAR